VAIRSEVRVQTMVRSVIFGLGIAIENPCAKLVKQLPSDSWLGSLNGYLFCSLDRSPNLCDSKGLGLLLGGGGLSWKNYCAHWYARASGSFFQDPTEKTVETRFSAGTALVVLGAAQFCPAGLPVGEKGLLVKMNPN
jgi:hypothetical protein